MHITPYKAMYFPNFIFLRKRLKSSHTSLKKLEKEDFNSINRYFISSLGDASPPGEDAPPNSADKLLFIAQNLYTFSKPLIYLSCFIFMFQLIDYQSFQKMKHTTLMFHFQFHVSLFKTLWERFHAPTVFLNRSLSVFESLPQCFYFSPSVFLE